MRVASGHLTYCTNIHPGETWEEVRQVLRHDVVAVKEQLCPNRAFGVGLRLSAQAAEALSDPPACEELQAQLAQHGLYVFTINGFPYGNFHGTRVKEAVYAPDWRTDQRRDYTLRLAKLLAIVLPEGMDGSISTVPGGFASDIDAAGRDQVVRKLHETVAGLAELHRRTGRLMRLALEPEPCCMLETTGQTVSFFEGALLAPESLRDLARSSQISPSRAERWVRRHLAVCLDACHAAVQFEQPRQCVTRLQAAGIRIAKLQLSSGLRVARFDPPALADLAAFGEDTYLHQVVARTESGLTRYRDLPEALAQLPELVPPRSREWRVHFHVPIFREHYPTFTSTQDFLRELLQLQRQSPFTDHLEVETYTWNVLPPTSRGARLHEDVVRELRWAQTLLTEEQP